MNENKKKKQKVKKMMNYFTIVLTIILTLLGIFIFRICNWVLKTWGIISLDEIIFHLKVPMGGTNSDMILDAVGYCLFPMIVVAFLVGSMMFLLRRNKKYQYSGMCVAVVITAGLGVFGITNIWNDLSVSAYIESKNSASTFIEDHYADPATVNLTFPEKKRNLIYIFLESVESTYLDKANGGAYDVNYMPELTKLAKENINFSNTDKVGGAIQTTGSTWTIGAMFSQTAGMPLILSIGANSMETQDTFFPKIISLGDILENNGYKQTLLIGSEAIFGGREQYFNQHGNYEILDYNYAMEHSWIPDGYRVFWGYEDKRLLEQAKTQLTKLGKGEEPFNFTMLTVDTHFEDGYVCELCQEEHDDQYGNVMACSSRQIYDLVEWIKQQDFYDNTTIVISGDHFTMDSDFCANIDSDYQRTVYNTILNSPVQPQREKNRIFTTLDMFPTTLASLGVQIDGDRLGLGTNLFSNEDTLAEQYSIEKLNTEFSSESKFYNTFTEDIVVNWHEINGKWYYTNENDECVTGWKLIGTTWYYFYEDGAMAANEWVDGYYLVDSGAWNGEYNEEKLEESSKE